jgi:uncharacterized protein YqeY
MTLIEQIRQKQISARKARSVDASLLTALLGEAEMVGKNAGNRAPTDEEVVAVVRKFIKNIDETIAALNMTQYVQAGALTQEKEVLLSFLPKQLDEEALLRLTNYCSDLPDFMRYLKQEYAGRYDGKLASAVAKEVYK